MGSLGTKEIVPKISIRQPKNQIDFDFYIINSWRKQAMKDGFIRVAAATPKVCVADPIFNSEKIQAQMDVAVAEKTKVLVFPELCLTAATCGDLFFQSTLLAEAKNQLKQLVKKSEDSDMLTFVGLPWEYRGQVYNVLAAIQSGCLLGLIPKYYVSNDEGRYFTPGNVEPVMVLFTDADGDTYEVPMGTRVLFACEENDDLVVAGEVGTDLWGVFPPSMDHTVAGATVVVNGSASFEAVGRATYRRDLVKGQSARLVCGYIQASAGAGESTTDYVFGGQNLIAENGDLLAESSMFAEDLILWMDLDLQRLQGERRRMGVTQTEAAEDYEIVYFSQEQQDTELIRPISQSPFIPEDEAERARRCEEILTIQAMGLKKRLEHTNCKAAVVGISGGLDSTLALLVMVRACDMLGLPRKSIVTVTMPCFGTTDRTYGNACTLMRCLGTDFREVNIREAVTQHFKDIGHDPAKTDVTFENAQARERTQVLMDIANEVGGMVIGTGDLSELVLGWATYNGDHMSMYGVNGAIPKTLVRHLVRYYADTTEDKELAAALYDVLDTPVSPELLPPTDGKISQKTEDLVGPYELHDFVLFYVLRYGYRPAKIYRMARQAFAGVYDDETIKKWLKTFYWRFFSQQFKRSCLADGPKVGSVGVSPRGDLRMPSDATNRIWREEVEKL